MSMYSYQQPEYAMNLWPLNDDQVFRLTVFVFVLLAIVIPLFLYSLWKESKRVEISEKREEFDRLRIKRKRS